MWCKCGSRGERNFTALPSFGALSRTRAAGATGAHFPSGVSSLTLNPCPPEGKFKERTYLIHVDGGDKEKTQILVAPSAFFSQPVAPAVAPRQVVLRVSM